MLMRTIMRISYHPYTVVEEALYLIWKIMRTGAMNALKIAW